MKYVFGFLCCLLLVSAVVADLSGDLRASYVVVSTAFLLGIGAITMRN